MRKRYLRNVPVYLLTTANVIYAVSNGFNWLTWVALGLSAVLLVLDIVEVIRHGKK